MRSAGLILAAAFLTACSPEQPAPEVSKDVAEQVAPARPEVKPPVQPRSMETFLVDSQKAWQDSGVSVAAGESIVFKTLGRYSYRPGSTVGPDGLAGKPDARSATVEWPAADLPALALIGRVGSEGEPFLVGTHAVRTASATGNLFFMVNDDVTRINWGGLTVAMQKYAAGEDPPGVLAEPVAAPEGTTMVGFDVDPRGSWQDAGVDMQPGETVLLSCFDAYLFASGKQITADGLLNKPDAKAASGSWPSPDLPGLALIGRIRGGDGKAFFVGKKHSFKAENAGRLFLMVNDDRRSANKGALHVKITVISDQ